MKKRHKPKQEEMKANHAKTNTNLVEMTASQELLKEVMLANLDAHHERIMARMYSKLEKMEAYLGKTEAMDLEANPESMVEHEEVLKEEATVKPVRVLKKQHGDRHLAMRRHGQPRKQT
jgi:hypothetical protein